MECLESRLGGILSCPVCLDLPNSAVFQCTNGHLMSVCCFNHLLADANMERETATCPSCGTEMSHTLSSRNLAVEKAIWELPAQCKHCSNEYSRNTLEKHEQETCEKRTTKCRFNLIGCEWCGPFDQVRDHESICTYPHRSGGELIDYLITIDETNIEEKKIYDILSYKNIAFNDVKLKFVKLCCETRRFYAFSHHWVIQARTNEQKTESFIYIQQFAYPYFGNFGGFLKSK